MVGNTRRGPHLAETIIFIAVHTRAATYYCYCYHYYYNNHYYYYSYYEYYYYYH